MEIKSLDKFSHNTKYGSLFHYSHNAYKLININILFNYTYYLNGEICGVKYEENISNNIIKNILFDDSPMHSKKLSGFNFQNIIIKNLYPKGPRLIITNASTVLYNFANDEDIHKSGSGAIADVILLYNTAYTPLDIEKKSKNYATLKNLKIYSSHDKAGYLAFLKNVQKGNDLHDAIPGYNNGFANKYDFISYHNTNIHGLNQTASIKISLYWTLDIASIGIALKYLGIGGTLVIFTTIANTHIPAYQKLIGLLAHSFKNVKLVSNDINQNILTGVPEFYFKCTGFKANISTGLLNALIQCGIDCIDNVYNVCDIISWLESYIERNPAQSLFYKASSGSGINSGDINRAGTYTAKISKTTKVSSRKNWDKTMRISQFVSGDSNVDRRTKKTGNKNSKKSLSKEQQKMYYIDDINIPELNAIIKDDNVEFRVMVLCNQIEALFIGFFDMVNYHIENSIEYDSHGVPRVSELAIKQNTVSNLRRLLEFLEYNKLPYNRHILTVLQEKQNDLLDSFYNLYAPIESKIIHYGDLATKQLDRRGWDNLRLGAAYPLDNIASQCNRLELAYSVQKKLLDQLNLDKIPAKVQYATEDMTRGLAKFIMKRFETTLPHHIITNAFIKMWECLSASKVIPKTKVSKYRVFHICEAPGQMILAVKYFIEKKRQAITDYDWRANSLNPYNAEVRAKYGRVFSDEYGLMRGNPKKWLWGADGTGDITRVANVRWFRDYIQKEMPDLNLIIGDGGLGSGSDTLVLQRLDLAQAVMVLACSQKGGSCIIKHFMPFMPNHPDSLNATSFFIGFMYLYYLAFSDVELFKPYSSDMTSGEFYVVGKGFRGLGTDEDKVLARLYRVLEKFQINQSLFSEGEMPDTFKMQIEGFIKQMVDYNVIGYEKTNLVLTCYKELGTGEKSEKSEKSKTRKGSNSDSKSRDKLEKYLKCGNFLDEDKIEEILVPRYNKWIKLYEFV